MLLLFLLNPSAGWAVSPIKMGAGVPALAAHRASYVLSLHSSTGQDVMAAHGSMTYELTDGCSGWSTSQHLLINMTNRDGAEVKMVSDYGTFESKDGTRLNFHARQVNDGAVTEAVDGTAVLDRSGGRGHADYTAPDAKRVALPPGTLLPNAHTMAILHGAMAGARFLAMPLFDGTGADGAQDSFVVIEGLTPPHAQKFQALSGFASSRVHVAFFSRDDKNETPDYEVGMHYYMNGAADELLLNFGDFVMKGKLDQLSLKNDAHC